MVGAHATHKAQPFSGQILQNDPGATAYVQELVSLQWQSPTAECVSAGVQVLNCTRALHRTYGYGGKTLFQRQTMRAAWNHSFSLLDGARVNRIALLGSPGAGKSRSMAGYGLRELLIREDPPDVIVFEARKASRVYTFMKAADSGLWTAKAMTSKKFDPAECQYLQNPNNYYFIDAGVEFPQEIVVDAKTIKACSPDRRHYSDFLKESGTRAYFESFTASELSAIHPYLDYAPDLETMATRFRRAGGNLRVLMSAEADFQAYCEEQQKDAENFQLCKSALMGVLESGGDELRTRLFTYRSNDSKNREVGFCSEGAFQLVVDKHYESLVDMWCPTTYPIAPFALEDFAGDLLTAGLQRWSGQEGPISLPANVLQRERGKWVQTPTSFEVQPGSLLECDSESSFDQFWKDAISSGELQQVLHSPHKYPGIDYLLTPNHGVQVTQARSHSISQEFQEKLTTFLAGATPRPFLLTFLVTDADKFRPNAKDFDQLTKLPGLNVTVQVVQVPKKRDSIPVGDSSWQKKVAKVERDRSQVVWMSSRL